ncbi:hypothetical protein EDC04DRAFT_2613231 [Pisolithus marmoratus]|nr:hypothetical protein EDC04DRAFT_2613231 [Pisolithus marmoratus]
MTNEVEFWVYPLAFMQKYGNMKAHGIIPNMAACIGKLNESIFRGGMEDDDMEVDKGGEERVGLASQKVTGDGQLQDLQFENMYMVELTWIQEELWNGWSIYEEIICPLLKAWSHLQVLGPIKDSLKLFKADIILELFKCVTYLVTMLMEMIWAKHKQDLEDKRSINTCMIEVMSMLERTLNFAHMGNAVVTVRWHEWPVEAETQQPMTSSKQAQQLTYGKAHYEAYKAKFTIKLAIENLLPNAYSHISDASFRQACYAADVAFRVYFDDVKKLVREGVTAETMAHLCLEDQLTQQSAQERLTALGHWMDERYPLSYMPGVLSNLLQVILSFSSKKDGASFQSASARECVCLPGRSAHLQESCLVRVHVCKRVA